MNRTSLAACVALFLFCSAEFAVASNATFIHTTDVANVSGDSHITVIDNPLTNGKPNQLVFASQVYGAYNPHQVGMWYASGKWKIYNQNRTSMPKGMRFSLLSLDPGQSRNAFQHRATAQTTGGSHLTRIDHPLTNGNPNAFLLVTPVYGLYDTNAIGVWYNGRNWTVFHQNRQPMKEGSLFNVLVLQAGSNQIAGDAATAWIHTAAPSTIGSGMPWVTTTTNSDKDAIPFLTQYYGSSGAYNDHIPGLWFNGKWTVFNQDRAKMPQNAGFNILAFSSTGPALPPPTPQNQAPVVEAGNNLAALVNRPVQLVGSVRDDGMPAGSRLSASWSVQAQPGTGNANFTNASAASTTATFSQPGSYQLVLTASDGQLQGSDFMLVTVQPAPSNPVPDNPPPPQPVNLSGTWKADLTGWRAQVTHRGNSFTARLLDEGSWTTITGTVSGKLISGSVTYKNKRPRIQGVNGQLLDDKTVTWNTGAVWRKQ